MTFCRQLPAWSTYEQAGARFSAGDYAGAARLAEMAAKAGNPLAATRLAMLYEAGQGVKRDGKSALYWYSIAAQAGDPAAQSELGGYYEEGDGVAEDWLEAAKWYTASASLGWHMGQFDLGRAYQYGIGVPLNLQTALHWYERAAAQSHPRGAQNAKYLRDNKGFDGSCMDAEEAQLLGLGCQGLTPPAGSVFRNHPERIRVLRIRAWEAAKRAYERCQWESKDVTLCVNPGPRPN
jgi:TPR repeat protein